jgi:hypothetical protein
MRKLAHIINPVAVNEQSDLFIAQPITFASMLFARQFAERTVRTMSASKRFPAKQRSQRLQPLAET